MSKKTVNRLKTTILLVLGFLLTLGLPVFLLHQHAVEAGQKAAPSSVATLTRTEQSVMASSTPKPEHFSGLPVQIDIPDYNISLPVALGTFNYAKQTWSIGPGKAYFADVSALANTDAGSTFIYGHNSNDVFGRLNESATGFEAIVTTENGHKFHYKLRTSYETNPNDTSVLHYQGAPILTLQTCSGTWSQHRHMFIFDLVSAN